MRNSIKWFRTPAELQGNGLVTVQLPAGTTHYFINLIDENNFLVSYPDLSKHKGREEFAEYALKVGE